MVYLEDVRFQGLPPFSFWRPEEKVFPFPVRRLYPEKRTPDRRLFYFSFPNPFLKKYN